MSVAAEMKDARIEFKTTKEIKSLLQNAANALGMDLSSFLIATATQRAKNVMVEEKLLVLSQEEWQGFEKELTDPKPATEALKNLMEREPFGA